MTVFVVAYPLIGHSNGAEIKRFRQKYDQNKADLIEAHFTLAFAITTFTYDDVLDHTRHLAKEFQPFEFLLNRLVPYSDQYSGDHMLFLCTGQGEQQLINIYNRFYEGRFMSARQIDEAFESHMTIATTRDIDQLVSAQAAAANLTLPIYGSVSGLNVIEILDGEISQSTHVSF
jgi:2'-5' RNA ligase